MLGMDKMTLADLVAIARQDAPVAWSDRSARRVARSRRLIEKWVREERTVYGLTTGFGALSDVTISRRDTRRLQENILQSHAAGVGQPMEREAVRAMVALRIKDLLRGHAGIRLKTIQHLASLLNRISAR